MQCCTWCACKANGMNQGVAVRFSVSAATLVVVSCKLLLTLDYMLCVNQL
jgi:hypothetical protein